MSSRTVVAPQNLEWKKAYLAAILETDRGQIPGLVRKAREKLKQRLHELWTADTAPCEETEAIHKALGLLDALLSSLSSPQDLAGCAKWDQDN